VNIFQALILGVVQGLTEFLPISSSGHLVLVPYIFGWKQPTVAFIVAVHLGTTASVIWVFRERLVELVRALFDRGSSRDRRFIGLLAIGTVPAAIVGAIFSSQVDRVFERPVVISFLLAGTAWILFTSETHYERKKEHAQEERDLTPTDAALIGAAQAVAILPGISRSGSTIGTGMWRGLSREAAARFSFLMAIPIILGAALVKLPDMFRQGASGSAGAMILGVIASAIVGVISIRWMLGLVARKGFRPFAIYCVLASIAGILTALARG
jgi:undecaprenyl-diphosphatase